MCVAVRGEVISLEPRLTAIVDFGGSRRMVSVTLPDSVAARGFVDAHAGFPLHRVNPEEACQTFDPFREVLDGEVR
jgi:hydrogenase maturation factor